MKLKHIANWKNNEIDLQKVYTTIWTESYYWKNKIQLITDADAPRPVVDMLQGIETIAKMLNQSFDTEPIRQIMLQSKYLAELLKEYIFEDVRYSQFPSRPSRKQCLYLLPILADVDQFATQFGFDLAKKTIVEIETLQDDNIHFADISLLDCNLYSHDDKIASAKKYWAGVPLAQSTEILYTGDFRITKVF